VKYLLILVWLSAAGEELHKQNFIEYDSLAACEAHMANAQKQKGMEGFPGDDDEVAYTLKDAYCKKLE